MMSDWPMVDSTMQSDLRMHPDALVSTISLCAATSSSVCGLYFSTHGASSFPSTIMGALPLADIVGSTSLRASLCFTPSNDAHIPHHGRLPYIGCPTTNLA